jgi:hypothetical protein
MMQAVTESLNRDAADRLGILVGCVAVGSASAPRRRAATAD